MEAYDVCLPCGQILVTLKLPELILFGALALLALISLFSKFNIISMLTKISRIVEGGRTDAKPKKRKNKASSLPRPPDNNQNIPGPRTL